MYKKRLSSLKVVNVFSLCRNKSTEVKDISYAKVCSQCSLSASCTEWVIRQCTSKQYLLQEITDVLPSVFYTVYKEVTDLKLVLQNHAIHCFHASHNISLFVSCIFSFLGACYTLVSLPAGFTKCSSVWHKCHVFL